MDRLIFNQEQYIICRGLWRGVLLQAFRDLKSKSLKSIEKINRIKAVLWFNLQNKDFLIICSYADLDPFCVWERSQEIKSNHPMIPL